MHAARALNLSIASLVAAALAATSVAAVPGAADAASPTSAKRAGSDIALKATAYGTRLGGGEVPAGSGATALSVIGCTGRPGVDHGNVVADADLPSLGTASGVKTKVWTRKRGASLHSYSRSSTAEVLLADTPLGSLSIRAISSLSHAWHDGKGFHAATRSSVGRIVFTPPVGAPQDIDIPTPGNPVTVPGLATITVGYSHKSSNQTGSSASAIALRVEVIPTRTDLIVARSKAIAVSGVEHGRFGGYSAGTEADVLGGVLTSGRNPLTLMPCQGTAGKVTKRRDADVDLGGGLRADVVASSQWAKRFDERSEAWERGSVAGVDLGDGALVIDAVVGKATVARRDGGGLERSAAGTKIGSITVNGEPQDFPLDQTLTIPGVAELQPKVVQKLAGGLKVVALRVTLLDSSGAVIDLGVAKTTIRR
jgi:hypothetical protein